MTKIPQSQIDVYIELFEKLLLHCCVSRDSFFQSQSRKDFLTLKSRSLATSEGLSFLTKTLPMLGKALNQGLTNSKFTVPDRFPFRMGIRNRSVPLFLGAYFNLVFNEEGVLRDDAPLWAIAHIENVCFAAYKLEVPYTPEEENAVLEAFKETEAELADLSLVSNADVAFACDLTGGIYDFGEYISIFGSFDPEDILPKHGPGAVASGQKGDEKWVFTTKYTAIHQTYPYYSYFMVGRGLELLDRLEWYKNLCSQETGTAKVVLVPKDSRGPRLISTEPLEYMWLQQGLGVKLSRHLESSRFSKGQINFTDQSINRCLALTSSIDGEFATLDLKDASDRVSLDLVSRVFKKTPRLLKSLKSLRTTATRLPNGELITLKKFAPMGSALCFPVEAYIFWIIIVAAISRRKCRRATDVMKLVYVYGDDIIVPVEYANIAMQALESVGLRVNASKSCIQGYFRESCGMDAFKGIQITPLRWKKLWTGSSADGSCLASYSALANAYKTRGYDDLSDLLWKKIEATYGRIPWGTSVSPFICKIIPDASEAEALNKAFFRHRWNKNLQRFEFKFLRLKAEETKTELDGWTRLLRNLTSGSGDDPSVYVVPRTTKIKRRWTSVY